VWSTDAMWVVSSCSDPVNRLWMEGIHTGNCAFPQELDQRSAFSMCTSCRGPQNLSCEHFVFGGDYKSQFDEINLGS
jgi:hypothetical protein